MSKYYYLVSQLPFLSFGVKPYPDTESFLSEAQKWLSAGDFSTLSQSSINGFYPRSGGNKTLEKYKEFEMALRREIASFRSKGNRGAESFGLNLSEGTPLEAEKRLLLLRWEFIESLEGGHFFDLEILILYFLKIQILERLFSFDREAGTARFDRLCEVAM